MTRAEWLQSLKVGDQVIVWTDGGCWREDTVKFADQDEVVVGVLAFPRETGFFQGIKLFACWDETALECLDRQDFGVKIAEWHNDNAWKTLPLELIQNVLEEAERESFYREQK